MDEMSLAAIQELARQHRPLWEEISLGIPAWHPRAEGDDSGGGDGGGDGDTGTGDKGGGTTATTTPEQQAVIDAAHTKLREAEKRADKLAAQVKRHERAQMDEAERKKAEQDEKDEKIIALEARLNEADRKVAVENIATELKFKKPTAAIRFVPAGVTDEREIRAALREAISDIPELVSTGAAPPPVNDPKAPNNNGSENNRMNNALRAAAGRR